MDAIAPGDQIALLAGVVIPAVIALGAVAAAVVRYVVAQSRCLALLRHQVESLILDSTRGRDVHGELYERLRDIDVRLAAIQARLDAGK